MIRHIAITFILILSAIVVLAGCADNPADPEPVPVAIFSWSGGVRAPATITFENLSQNADEYYWRFGDGTASSDKNPVHIYSAPGLYAVILRAVRSSNGSANETNQFLSIIAAPPVVDFSWSGDTITPATITFSNLSQNADDYLWDFGDGSNSTAANPIHIFYGARTFRVRLTATERASGQSATRSKDIRIVWADPVADFDWTGRTIVDSYIQLNNRSQNSDGFVWKYSDGSPPYSGLDGPRIIRYQPVNLFVTLIARNSTTTKVDSVTKLLAISPPNVSLVRITINQLPWTDSLGNPWDIDGGPDLMIMMYNSTGGSILGGGDVLPDLRPERLPVVYTPAEGPIDLPRVNWSGSYRIDFHDLGVAVAPFGRLMGQVFFGIDSLKLTQGYRGVYSVDGDSFKVDLGMEWR